MRNNNFVIFVLLCLLTLLFATDCRAQAGYLHVELQGGYELFHDMNNKSGYDYGIGCRYAFNDKFFASCLLHGGINNGTYKGMYAGEMINLDHTMREYMIGAGPGMYLYNGGNRWIFADILFGYGFGEELKSASESIKKSLNSFASAARIGVEYQLNNGIIIGLNTGGYLVGGQIRPVLNFKVGAFLNL